MNSNIDKNHKILLIEDDMRMNNLLSNILSKNNYEVSYALTLFEAKNILNERKFAFDILLLDYHLPDGKGDNFFEWVKISAPTLPVVFVSADRNKTMIVKCFKAGAADFIEKPFDINNVITVLNKTIKNNPNRILDDKLNAEVFTQDWIELSATSEIDYLDRIQRLCSLLLSKHLNEETAEDIKLAMEEYGRNAIEWGNHFDKAKIFTISYCIFNDRVVLKFEDEGDGFDLKSIPDPSQDPIKHLKSREEAGKRPGGYGIFMMKNIMDEVLYNDKGNVCIMTKYLK